MCCIQFESDILIYAEFLDRIYIDNIIKRVDKNYQYGRYRNNVAEIITKYLEERFNAYKGFFNGEIVS